MDEESVGHDACKDGIDNPQVTQKQVTGLRILMP